MQNNFGFTKSEWVPPHELPDITDAKVIAFDLETYDPQLKTTGPGWTTKTGHIIGVAVAVDGWKGYYPIRHENGFNWDRRRVLTWVKKLMQTNAIKVAHNAIYDLGWLHAEGIEVKGPIVDTMIAAALINENRFSYSLNALSVDYLNEIKAETELREAAAAHGIDPKAEMWKLPAEHVGYYAEQDAELTLKLWQRFKHEITSQSLITVWEMEQQLLPILIKMRQRGVRVQVEKAAELQKEMKLQEKEILLDIQKEIGIEIDIWAPRQIAKAFDKLKLEYPRTEKTKEPSFTQNWLINNKNKIAQLIVSAREVNKFHGTFLSSIMKYQVNGRIHGEINQLRGDNGGTVSGRLSMSNPNLQQVPSRNKDFGPKIRSLFIPEEGHKWGSFDYSQQEPRMTVHYAASIGDGYEGSNELVDAYQNASADFHQTVADLVGIDRTQAKTIGLGLMYGMGKNKLANSLGVSKDEANELIIKYNKKVPFVKKLSDRCKYAADEKGVIRTKKGRKCRFDMWETRDFGLHQAEKYEDAVAKYGKDNIKRAYTYKALNRLIQGSSADQTKQSMLDCYNAGHLPMLQIHDELCFNIKDEAHAKEIQKLMQNTIEFKVPSVVEYGLGESWGDAK